ncbi:MAG: GAF domain-containing protein, partial [Pyrinomonadaceae bacterium]
MKSSIDHIKSLADACLELLDHEERTQSAFLVDLTDAVRLLQSDTEDRRLRQLSGQIKELQERSELFLRMTRNNFLAEIKSEIAPAQAELDDARLGRVLAALTQRVSPSLKAFCETLLDQLITATGAERGFILYYLPETTEAEVVAARHFETTNLSLAEYDVSRTLLREIFARGSPLLLEDAVSDSAYGREASVQRLDIRSVLGAPMLHGHRTVGALYLENRSLPCAFNAGDCRLLETVARFVV